MNRFKSRISALRKQLDGISENIDKIENLNLGIQGLDSSLQTLYLAERILEHAKYQVSELHDLLATIQIEKQKKD